MSDTSGFDTSMGGKARGLFQLKKMGLTVPDFFCIPYEVFDPVLKNATHEDLIREHLLNFQLDQKVWSQIKEKMESWNFPEMPVVVRSSALDEDGEDNSFAGIMDSFLNVRSLKGLHTAIIKCASSAYSPRAQQYRTQKGLSSPVKLAVIVQLQIEAAVSGVMFTTSPVYPQETAIHATYGLGQALVDGEIVPDEFYFLKKSGKLHRKTISIKTHELTSLKDGSLSMRSVSGVKRERAAMNEDLLEFAFAKAEQIEKEYGPRDIEFCISQEGTFYFLQSRPITSEIPKVTVFDNSNIQESYCGVTTPLTFSFASRAYSTVYRQTMNSLGISKKTIDEFSSVLDDLLALKKGRIYYNINNWYRGLQLLPSFKQNKSDMESMMGLEKPVDFVKDIHKSSYQKIRSLPSLTANLVRLLIQFARLDRLTHDFKTKVHTVYDNFYNNHVQIKSQRELQQVLEPLDDLLNNWEVPIINDFRVMMMNGKAKRALFKIGIEDVDVFLARYLAGDDEIESAYPTREIMALAQEVSDDPALKSLINSKSIDLHSSIKKEQLEFHEKVEQFISRYGDRTIGELKLETITMRVDPAIFYQYLKNLTDLDKPQDLTNSVSSSIEALLDEKLTGKTYFKRKALQRKLNQLKLSIRRRESLRLDRTKLFGMYRSAYRRYAEHLFQAGVIEHVDDIFYLEEDEVKHGDPSHYKTIISTRKTEFDRYRLIEMPSRIEEPGPPVAQQVTDLQSDVLRGQGCVPGIALGEVIIIKDPTDDLDVKEKIIVAQRTDPGWCALFPACKGVIIEKGSMLSHSVILLRELGIPTMVNVPHACKLLNSGQIIKLNADTGTIHLESQP